MVISSIRQEFGLGLLHVDFSPRRLWKTTVTNNNKKIEKIKLRFVSDIVDKLRCLSLLQCVAKEWNICHEIKKKHLEKSLGHLCFCLELSISLMKFLIVIVILLFVESWNCVTLIKYVIIATWNSCKPWKKRHEHDNFCFKIVHNGSPKA